MAEDRSAQKVWTLTAVQDWAAGAFPDAFAALPGIESLEFEDLDESRVELYRFRIPTDASKKLLRIGRYDDFSPDSMDRVFAFVHGEYCNQVGYIRESLTSTSPQYTRISLDSMTRVDVEEPLCYIADGKWAATLTRLRTLVCYYFLVAGHISQFGGYESFTREFQKACLYIEHGRTIPEDPHPKRKQRCSSSHSHSADAASDDELSDAESVLVKVEDLPNILSDDTIGGSCYHSSSPSQVDAASSPQKPERHRLPNKSSVENLLHSVNVAYTKLEKGNKRLKLTMTETQTKDNKLITALRVENAKLKTRNKELTSEISAARDAIRNPVAEEVAAPKQSAPNSEKSDHALANLHNVFKRRLARAQEEVSQAERRGREASGRPCTEEREELRTQLREQTARADAAESKLAGIRGYVVREG